MSDMEPVMARHNSATATVLDRLVEHLRARDVAADGQERPAAILWTDPKAEWHPLVDLMQARVEELLVLGSYRPEVRSGPAVWIRCLVDGVLQEPALPSGRAPIVYLPGVARQDLRAGEDCRPALRPLVELMYRGTMWLQPGGGDWTVTAFLTSSRGLDLDIARDRDTADALLRALPEVGLTPVTHLADKRLHADDFDRLLAADVLRDLLRWMGDPAGTRTRLGQNGWLAFCSRCRDELGFDPATEADVVAGERLGRGEGAWAAAWDRFEESPTSYPGLAQLLRRSRPVGDLPFARGRWPDLNERDEDAVRKALAAMKDRAHGVACEAVAQLEKEHGHRRGWVWARMGLAPLSQVLEPLARLATLARTVIGGTTPADVAAGYLAHGWQADAASWEAIAAAPTAEERLVSDVVRGLLGPWLDESARAFQAALARAPLPGRGAQPAIAAGDDG
jgi:hypothetical protein